MGFIDLEFKYNAYYKEFTGNNVSNIIDNYDILVIPHTINGVDFLSKYNINTELNKAVKLSNKIAKNILKESQREENKHLSKWYYTFLD